MDDAPDTHDPNPATLRPNVASSKRTHLITVVLDEERAARLRRMADRSYSPVGTLARSLLSRAIDEAEMDGATMLEVLNGIPGARESTTRSREQFARGGVIPVDEL